MKAICMISRQCLSLMEALGCSPELQTQTYRFRECKHGRGAKQEVDSVFVDQGPDQRFVLLALT
eukprot:517936-Pelagomonas_calceolata.AAC.2